MDLRAAKIEPPPTPARPSTGTASLRDREVGGRDHFSIYLTGVVASLAIVILIEALVLAAVVLLAFVLVGLVVGHRPTTRAVARPTAASSARPHDDAARDHVLIVSASIGAGHDGAAVELARQDVQYVGRPGGESAEAHRMDPDSSVDDAALGGGEFPGQAAKRGCRYAAAWSHALGGEGLCPDADLFETADVIRHAAQVHEVLVKERVNHAHQEHGVGAGPHEEVLVGGAGPAALAACADRLRRHLRN